MEVFRVIFKHDLEDDYEIWDPDLPSYTKDGFDLVCELDGFRYSGCSVRGTSKEIMEELEKGFNRENKNEIVYEIYFYNSAGHICPTETGYYETKEEARIMFDHLCEDKSVTDKYPKIELAVTNYTEHYTDILEYYCRKENI